MIDKEDDILLEQIKRDDAKALEQLFSKYYYSLCHFARTLVKSNDFAEEAVSNVFFYLWQNRQTFHVQRNFKAYLFIAVKNQSLKLLNKHRIIFDEISVENENPEWLEQSAETLLQYHETRREIETLVDRLPLQRRIIFKLNRMEGLRYREIADRLDISVDTVQKQMTAAVKYMAQYKSKFLFFCLFFGLVLVYSFT